MSHSPGSGSGGLVHSALDSPPLCCEVPPGASQSQGVVIGVAEAEVMVKLCPLPTMPCMRLSRHLCLSIAKATLTSSCSSGRNQKQFFWGVRGLLKPAAPYFAHDYFQPSEKGGEQSVLLTCKKWDCGTNRHKLTQTDINDTNRHKPAQFFVPAQ